MTAPNEFGEERALCSETLELLKANDPRLTNLAVSWETEEVGPSSENSEYNTEQYPRILEFDFAHRVDWSTAGPLLAANTHLKKLSITGCTWIGIEHSDSDTYDRCKKAWEQFCKAVSRNKSIEHLHVQRITSIVAHTLIESLSPLLSQNNNLRRVELRGVLNASAMGSRRENMSILTAALKQCAGKSSLEELCICHTLEMGSIRGPRNGDDEANICKLVEALEGHRNLSKLVFQRCKIGLGGCTALGKLLQSAECNIADLSLEANSMVDTRNKVDDRCIDALTKSMANNSTLRSLNLHSNKYVTSSGWLAFFPALQASNLKLDGLNLGSNNVDDAAMAAFVDWLKQPRNNLRYLNLEYNEAVTAGGWLTFFQSLSHQPLLEELHLKDNSIDTDGAARLVSVLPNSLKKLSVGPNESISTAGWQSISGLLQNESMKLVELSVGRVDQQSLLTIANALSGNKTLELLGGSSSARGSEMSLESILPGILCDASSIDATFSSNHTLWGLLPISYSWVGEPARSLLEMNRNHNKSEVARQKILQHHFLGETADANFETFLDMGSSELPHAMAWMGRDVGGLHLMHRLIRSMPSLVGHEGCKMAGAKRAREE